MFLIVEEHLEMSGGGERYGSGRSRKDINHCTWVIRDAVFQDLDIL